MIRTTFKELTETITQKEGKKRNLSIAQVKEVTRLVLIELGTMMETDPEGLGKLLKRYQGK